MRALRAAVDTVRPFALVLLGLALLATATATLARHYHATRAQHAQEHFAAGLERLDASDREAAIVELRAALTLDRGNPEYALLLSGALLDAGRAREAEKYLDEAIRADPTSGPANLVRAGVARTLADPRAAVFYQRAFFGSWPAEDPEARLEAGFELVHYLVDRGDHERARATLAQLAAESTEDAVRSTRIARLVLSTGAPADAAVIAARATDRAPDDPAAWGVLAEASFAAGDDLVAARAAGQAARFDPDHARWPALARAANELIALDPNRPRLRPAERLRRARLLLEHTVADAERCETNTDALAAALDAIRPPARQPAAARLDADALLDLAVRVWEGRPPACPLEGPRGEALVRLFARLNPPGAPL